MTRTVSPGGLDVAFERPLHNTTELLTIGRQCAAELVKLIAAFNSVPRHSVPCLSLHLPYNEIEKYVR